MSRTTRALSEEERLRIAHENRMHAAQSTRTPPPAPHAEGEIERIAEAVNKGRYVTGGLPYRTLAESDATDRAYAYRIAREVLAALRSPQAPAAGESETLDELESGLTTARQTLINLEFCGPGEHGKGDPEVVAIDAALRHIRSQRRIEKLRSLGFTDAADFAASPSQPASGEKI